MFFAVFVITVNFAVFVIVGFVVADFDFFNIILTICPFAIDAFTVFLAFGHVAFAGFVFILAVCPFAIDAFAIFFAFWHITFAGFSIGIFAIRPSAVFANAVFFTFGHSTFAGFRCANDKYFAAVIVAVGFAVVIVVLAIGTKFGSVFRHAGIVRVIGRIVAAAPREARHAQ